MRQALRGSGIDTLRESAYTDAAAQPKEIQTGSLFGMEVEAMDDVYADLMDSMEELSQQFEEKTLKDVSQRKLGRAKMGEYVRAVEKWTKQFSDLPSGEFIDRVMKQLKQEKSAAMTPRDLLRMLGRGSSDPSHQFAMLDIMEQAFKEQGNEKLTKLIRDTKQLLNSEKGAEVRAGINIADEVNNRAKTPEQMQNLRDLYRGETLGFKGPQECFRSLLASRGPERMGESIDFLVKSCGIDLQNPSPSQSPEELRRIILDLQCVNVLNAMMEECQSLVGKMPKLFGETSLLNGLQLAGKITDLTELPFPSGKDISSLLASCGFAQLLAKIYFNTQLLGLLRGLSPRLFAEDGDRFKLLDATQENLDGLIKEEEESEEKKDKERKK